MLLQSPRLTYTKFTRNYQSAYVDLAMKDDVMKHITGAGLTHEQALERFQVALDADKGRDDMGFLAVNLKESGAFIGLGKIVPFENRMTEIGYALLPEFWGKGYASEITNCLVEYARELGSVVELIGLVDPGNQPSIRILMKHGFVFYREVINAQNLARADYVLKI